MHSHQPFDKVMAAKKAIVMRSYQNFNKEMLITLCFAFLPLFLALWCSSTWHPAAANLSRQFYGALIALLGSHHLYAFLFCNVLIVAIYSMSPIGRSPDVYEESAINSEYWWSIYLEPETTPEEEKEEDQNKQIAWSEDISAVVPLVDDNTKSSCSEEPTGRHPSAMEELNDKEFQQIIDDFILRSKKDILGEEIQSEKCMKEKGEEEDNRATTLAYMSLLISR
ncbi:hypothetical protein ACE6H2_020097 [Prunus campanulata]